MSQPPIRVLIVEDDQTDRHACRHALRTFSKRRFEFCETETGAAGLACVRDEAPDLILLDGHLPDIDALAFLDELVGQRAERTVPVIILASGVDVTVAVEAMRRGAYDWLMKDASRQYLDLLPAVVERVLHAHGLRAEKEEAETRLRLLTEAVPGLIGYIDREQRYRFNNTRYREWIGTPPEELRGLTLRQALGEELYEKIRPHVEAALAGKEQIFETVIDKRGTARRHVRVRYAPHLDARRNILGFYTLTTDITELKQKERELQKWRIEAARRLRLHTAGEMASAFAHELNQPLHSIAAYSEAALRLMGSGADASDKLVYALEQIALQAQRAGHVIRQLRTLLGRSEIEVAPMDLNALVREAMAQFDAEAYSNGFGTDLRLAEHLPPVMGNRVQIEQVLLNLARNAVEAMRDACMDAGVVTICTKANKAQMAQTTVRDSGPGFDPETVGRIFEAFYTTKAEGLGMGLTISRSLIEAHGGKLWADAAARAGATLHFTLPFAS